MLSSSSSAVTKVMVVFTLLFISKSALSELGGGGLLVQRKVQNERGAERLHLEAGLCKVDCLQMREELQSSKLRASKRRQTTDAGRW